MSGMSRARVKASPPKSPQTASSMEMLHRSAMRSEKPSVIPPIVHDVVKSPGRPLDAATRASMEPRFGHDFSRVRVHTDARAAASAHEVNAHAYAMGNNLVFNTGKYAPYTAQGQSLLVHELTHVVQTDRHSGPVGNRIAPEHHPSEREAEKAAQGNFHTGTAGPGGTLHRNPISDLLDKQTQINIAEAKATAQFVVSFLDAARKAVPPGAFEQLQKELNDPLNQASFQAGGYAGIVAGAVKDLYGSLKGLVELVIKTSPYYQMYSIADKGILNYFNEKRQEVEKFIDLTKALAQYIKIVVKDPDILITFGREFGDTLGAGAGKWFNDTFMTASPFMKGEMVGEVAGVMLMEIALLFVGPEELVIRGAALSAKAVEGTRAGRLIMDAMEKVPLLKSLLEARKLGNAGREAINAGEKGAVLVEKGVASAEKKVVQEASALESKAAHAPAAIEEKAVQTVPKKTTSTKTSPKKTSPKKGKIPSGVDKREVEILEEFGEAQKKGSSAALENDILEQPGMKNEKKPGGAPQPEKFDVGNFAHEYAEQLIDADRLPRGLAKEVEVILPDGSKRRLDRVDFANGIIYEIKPDTPSQVKAGEAQLKLYIEYMNQEMPLGDGRKWQGEVLAYDKESTKKLLKEIGWRNEWQHSPAEAPQPSKKMRVKVPPESPPPSPKVRVEVPPETEAPFLNLDDEEIPMEIKKTMKRLLP